MRIREGSTSRSIDATPPSFRVAVPMRYGGKGKTVGNTNGTHCNEKDKTNSSKDFHFLKALPEYKLSNDILSNNHAKMRRDISL
jgi:hypothetical protein